MNSTLLDIKNITKTFNNGKVKALNNVSLSLDKGKIVAIVGESGSRKTTLIRLITGLETQDAGSINFKNKVLSSETVFIKPEKRNIGMVFQEYALFPNFNVFDNISYGISKNIDISEDIVYIDGMLKNYDGVIATGSNNTSRYFDYYFKNKKSIIRKNRNSIAILDGTENENELSLLGNDIFTYFGLGCRNVSKLYVPKNYSFDSFYNSIFKRSDLINNHKYANNYDYNKAIYLMSEYKFLDNGFFMIKEGNDLHSPISTINYEFYDDISILKDSITKQEKEIQCIVSKLKIENKVDFGETQNPSLSQYADNIDVMSFLLTI